MLQCQWHCQPCIYGCYKYTQNHFSFYAIHNVIPVILLYKIINYTSHAHHKQHSHTYHSVQNIVNMLSVPYKNQWHVHVKYV